MTSTEEKAMFVAFGFLLGIMVFCSYEHWMLGLVLSGVVIVVGFIPYRIFENENK